MARTALWAFAISGCISLAYEVVWTRILAVLFDSSIYGFVLMLATVLFGIYTTSEDRIRDEFRSYGANLVAAPASGNTVPLAITTEATKLGAEVVPSKQKHFDAQVNDLGLDESFFVRIYW